MSAIHERFREAGVPLHLPQRPPRAEMAAVFQLSVEREAYRERVQLWIGGAGNAVDVLAVDAGWRQVLLKVREAPYRATVHCRVRGESESAMSELCASEGARLVGRRGSHWVVERWTSGVERRFLCGADQSHLFVAQVPAGDTVGEAHRALIPPAVVEADARGPGVTVRQGEWFFVRLGEREDREVRTAIAADPYAVRRGPIAWQGRPHVAEEVVRRPGELDGATGERLARIYVRGKVWHDDHRTVSFDAWRRVFLNAEVRRQSRRVSLYGVVRAPGLIWRD